MDQGHIFQFINVFWIVPTRRMLNGIEPRNTDQSHVNQYIYYSTEIKSKTARNEQNRFTYLQSSKKIYISRVPSVNKLLNGCKRALTYLQHLAINKAFWRVTY